MRSWKSAVKPVAAAVTRSTWGSPSTARRTAMPWSRRRWSSLSDGKERGLLLALQADVEAEPALVGDRDQPGPRGRVRDRGQHQVGGVGVGLVREVDAGHQ